VNRTKKEFNNLSSFSGDILVECPHCRKKAHVLADIEGERVPFVYNARRVFRCENCFQPVDPKAWYGPIIIFPAYGKCSKCGSDLKGKSRVVKKYQSKMKARCEVCHHEQFYKTRYETIQANDEQATDPYIGLPLWLQIPVGDEILWAYNYDHLELLKNYVSAKLREAQVGGKYSLTWKLPNFIKVAKNRDKILKAISRLEKKLL
jgi:DNA-directed RNA polymerase subunit RPC12/RpoP